MATYLHRAPPPPAANQGCASPALSQLTIIFELASPRASITRACFWQFSPRASLPETSLLACWLSSGPVWTFHPSSIWSWAVRPVYRLVKGLGAAIPRPVCNPSYWGGSSLGSAGRHVADGTGRSRLAPTPTAHHWLPEALVKPRYVWI